MLRRIDEAFPKEIRARVNESEMKIVFKNGSVWQVCGSDNSLNNWNGGFIGIVRGTAKIDKCIGADPVTEFCRDLGITNDKGYLVVHSDMSTAIV